ncbi:MAG TPA: alpha/beta fold hydrolase [Gammaproteobacteria bacterium]
MPDGYVLHLKTWPSNNAPGSVVLAVHGFNDYSNAFESVANHFAQHSITSYAIDQRGFGATAQNGIWPGHAVMQSDLVATVNLLCEKHADLPVFLLGESMGGAVILSAIQQLEPTCIKGVILSAPAVWGWQVMPWWQTMPLTLLAHTIPGVTVTGEGLDIKASDNVDMLRALGKDPLFIKETRIDAIYGLTDLMEAALVNSAALTMTALILYGEHDEIIPPESFCKMLENLPDQTTSGWRLVLYRNGYHMLSRDLQGEVVIQDMITWIHNQNAALPSAQEVVQDDVRLSVFSECDVL